MQYFFHRFLIFNTSKTIAYDYPKDMGFPKDTGIV